MARKIPAKRPARNASRHKQRGLLTMTGAAQPSELERSLNSRPNSAPIEALTPRQGLMIVSVAENTLTFATGPAGTGKTYLAAALAAEAFLAGDVERIIITRPMIEAGAPMGFLPGEAHEKFAPYLQPFRTELEKRLGRGAVEMFLKNERIVALPLSLMRGWNFDNAFVILDEAQNTTPTEMKMFLTRCGEGSRIVVDGDVTQIDLPRGVASGLPDALEKLDGMRSVGHVAFTRDDIVRSGFVQDVIERYEI